MSSTSEKKPEATSERKISTEILDESIFNSKIFIHLNSNDSLNNTYTQESENKNESEEETNEENNDYYLINELIEQIDSSSSLNTPKNSETKINFEEKKEDLSKNLLNLVDNGYEFLPKSYKIKQKTSNKYNIPIVKDNVAKKKAFQEREGDWVCKYCQNLNFAFRTKCNRCKAFKKNYERRKK